MNTVLNWVQQDNNDYEAVFMDCYVAYMWQLNSGSWVWDIFYKEDKVRHAERPYATSKEQAMSEAEKALNKHICNEFRYWSKMMGDWNAIWFEA